MNILPLRVALAQVNVTVGDLEGNTRKILTAMQQAYEAGAHIVCLPELALTGYPPEDLLLKPGFVADNLRKLHELVSESHHMPELTAVVGFVDRDHDIYNAAAIINAGRLIGKYHKHYLPNYGVFDENRYFQAGRKAPIFVINDVHVGVNICEDIWYPGGPLTMQAQAGAEVILNINGSPYNAGKGIFREEMLATRAADNGVIVAYLNTVGGQDELVFDGGSMVFNEQGALIARAKEFEEDMLLVDLDTASVFRSRLHDPRRRKERLHVTSDDVPIISAVTRGYPSQSVSKQIVLGAPQRIEPKMEYLQEIYAALVLGTGDYVRKTGFKKAIIALSGGIDSSLTAVIAVDALGAENVLGISMPSGYSSEGSMTDAQQLARNLGIQLMTIPIEETFRTSLRMLEPALGEGDPGLAAENLQARIRGNILTSAELRPNQKDVDSLPPYEVLDPILKAYAEDDRSFGEMLAMGFEQKTVERVMRLVDTSEYKRRQAPPGVKITTRAFGRDRRLPITNRYRESL